MKEQTECETQLNSQTGRMALEKAAVYTINRELVGVVGSRVTDPMKLPLRARLSVLQPSAFNQW